MVSGVADLRPPPRGASAPSVEDRSELDPLAVAALLAIPGGPGNVLLSPGLSDLGSGLAELVEGIEWILLGAAPGFRVPPGPFSPMVVRGRLPLYSGSLRGVVAVGEGSPVGLPEFARVLAPMGRIVVLDPPSDASDRLASAGLEVLLDSPEAAVGTRKS